MRTISALLLATSFLVTACVPGSGGGNPASSTSTVRPEAGQRTLVVATDTEPDGFGEMFAGGKSGPEQVQQILGNGIGQKPA